MNFPKRSRIAATTAILTILFVSTALGYAGVNASVFSGIAPGLSSAVSAWLSAPAAPPTSANAATPMFELQSAVDVQGADDEPGQKDLNFLEVDYSSTSVVLVNWGWDDTSTTGANTRDACSLFDTDGDGLANFSFCVIVETDGSVSHLLYSCGDDAADRCSQPIATIAHPLSTATAEIEAGTDPFGNPGPAFDPDHSDNNSCDTNPECETADTVARTSVALSEVGGVDEAILLNVCSYPSGQPNSDPSDCVLFENPGSLTLVKVVNNLGNSGPDYLGVSDFPLSIDGTATTSGTAVSVTPGDHSIAETAQFGYDVGTWSCTDGTSGTAGSATLNPVNISAGETVTCTITNTVNEDILDPQLTIVKDDNGATYDSVGDVITYSITATNTGNTTLAAVTITDANAVLGTCTPANGSSLAPGASITCAATHTVVQADIDAGSYLNTACVNDGPGGAAQVCDDETTPGVQSPSLSIVKDDNGATYDSVGDVITYSITATNTGNTTLAAVTITDANAVLGICTPANGSSLAPGASITCSATHTVVQADIDAGSYLNTACVNDGPGGAAQVCDDETTPGVQSPSLSIVKDDNGATYDSVGDVITYSITATNTGNTTLAAVTITDANAVLGICTPANGSSLAPGASITCSATHTVVQADIDAGSYLNTACVNDGPGGAAQVCDDETTPGVQSPSLSIVKDDNGATYDSVGDVITYSITATNTGNTTLAAVTITDANAVLGICTPANGSSLAPGASITCSATHTVVQADIDAGSYLNTACVNDGPGGAAQVCDDETTPGVQSPSLSIVKDDNGATYDSVGDVITYSITATNTGNTTLAAVTITDANAVLGICTPANGSSLAPGASITCSATHTVVQADIDAGSYLNTACVNDGPGGAAQVCDDETTPGVQSPSLSIVKDDNGATYDSVGDVITYSITATNTGNTTLAAVTITDANAVLGICTPANGSSLAPGASITCSATHTVVQADIDAGSYLNTACVNDGPGGASQACDDESTPGDQNPALSLEKTSDTAVITAVGQTVTYTYVVTNTGNVTLTGVTLVDDKVVPADITCSPTQPTTLAPGGTMTCTGVYTVTQADIDSGGPLVNVAIADSDQTNPGEDDTVSIPIPPGHLELTKTVNGVPRPDLDIQFRLYLNGDPAAAPPDLTVPPDVLKQSLNILGDADGELVFDEVPPGNYTACEFNLLVGYNDTWLVNGNPVLSYNPEANDVPAEDTGIRCVDFTIAPGATVEISVANTSPQGDAHTIGFWKNWTSCDGKGNQAPVLDYVLWSFGGPFVDTGNTPDDPPPTDDPAIPNLPGGPDDPLTYDPGVWLGNVGDGLNVDTCQEAVSVLSKQVLAGRVRARGRQDISPFLNLASQLLAAKLNIQADASASCIQPVIDLADDYLSAYNYRGTLDVDPLTQTDKQNLLLLAGYLDDYNNNTLVCPVTLPPAPSNPLP